MSVERRFGGAGIRREIRSSGRRPGGAVYIGPAYDSGDWTFTRASEAAYYDPRSDAFQGVGEWDALTSFPASIAGWTAIGGPTETDEGGGVWTTGDTAGAAYSGHRYTTSGISVGRRYRVTYQITKDSDETRFPEFQNISGSSYTHFQLNTATGATTIRLQSGLSPVVSSSDGGAVWVVTFEFTAASATTTHGVYPAMTTTFGGASSAATGTLTWEPGVVFETEAAWLADNVPRVFSDGAVLIEGARTNLLPRSSDLDSPTWTKLGGTPTLVQDEVAPDGSAGWSFDWAGGGSDLRQAFTLADSTDFVGSVFLRQDGASDLDWRTRDKAGALAILSTTPGSEWARYALADNTATGGNAPIVQLVKIDSAEFAMFNAQVEAGAFASSPIRTSGATATRARDQMRYVIDADMAAALEDPAGWKIDHWPSHPNGEGANGYRLVDVDAWKPSLWRVNTANQWRLGSISQSCVVTMAAGWLAGDKLTFHCVTPTVGDWTLTVTNERTGETQTHTDVNPSVAVLSGKTLGIGHYLGGTSWDAYGVCSRIYK